MNNPPAEKKQSGAIRLLDACIVCLGVVVMGMAICALLIYHFPKNVVAIDSGESIQLSQTSEHAEEELDESIESTEPPEVDPWEQGMAFAESGDWEASIEPLMLAVAQNESEPMRYLKLADAYCAIEDYEKAVAVLKVGVDRTGAKELNQPLWVAKTNANLLDYQQELMNGLLSALSGDDTAVLEDALEIWNTAEFNALSAPTETPWMRADRLTWDGSRFHASYTGTGLLFDRNGIYYGEIKEGTPHGLGSYFVTDTWYMDGSIEYLRLDAQWQNGIAIGDGLYRSRSTSDENHNIEYDIVCSFDGSEHMIMASADITIYPLFYSGGHEIQLKVSNGNLVQDNMGQAYGYRAVHCSAHQNCGCFVYIEDSDLTAPYQNPYPWDEESPYGQVYRYFMNFSYGY